MGRLGPPLPCPFFRKAAEEHREARHRDLRVYRARTLQRADRMDTEIRLMTRIAFGFTSPDALIALAMLSLGGYKPVLP